MIPYAQENSRRRSWFYSFVLQTLAGSRRRRGQSVDVETGHVTLKFGGFFEAPLLQSADNVVLCGRFAAIIPAAD